MLEAFVEESLCFKNESSLNHETRLNLFIVKL